MTKKAIDDMAMFLERHHEQELKPLVKKVLDILTNEDKKKQLIPNDSEEGARGFGFKVGDNEPTPHIKAIYNVWVAVHSFYTGRGNLNNRLGRFCQAFMGEDCETSKHRAGIWLRENTIHDEIRTKNLYCSRATWDEDIKPVIEELDLQYDTFLESGDTKEYIKRVCASNGAHISDPYLSYIEYKIMNILGSIGNTMGIENKALVAQNIQSFYTKDYAINNKNQWAA